MLYLDTSALVKKYFDEPGSNDVRACISTHPTVATSTITRAESAAAIAKAIRLGVVTESAGKSGHRLFVREWKNYIRIRVTESLVSRADGLAWTYALRGYDAVHLAAALEWHDQVGETVMVATFDQDLWRAAGEAGLDRFPAEL